MKTTAAITEALDILSGTITTMADPLHIEAVRALRAIADHIEEAGECRAFVAVAIVSDKPDCVEFGGEMGVIEGVLDRIRTDMADATFIHADTDLDALDVAAV